MPDRLHLFLKYTAIAMVMTFIGWSLWDSFIRDGVPGDSDYLSANNLFEDGHYERALQTYGDALQDNPEHVHALRGYARSLMQLQRYDEALAAFNEAISRAPGFAFSYANRGILHDRMGNYEDAIADYKQAMRLDIGTAKGPNWLTRFLRLQPDKPPGIAERARYLQQELAKPSGQRLLRVPDLDAQQRSYKQ